MNSFSFSQDRCRSLSCAFCSRNKDSANSFAARQIDLETPRAAKFGQTAGLSRDAGNINVHDQDSATGAASLSRDLHSVMEDREIL